MRVAKVLRPLCADSHFFLVCAVPADVTQLFVRGQGRTDSLQTSWAAAEGDVDSYRVLLIHDSVVIKNESVSANTTACQFHSLMPGALYRVVVTTVSGGLSSKQAVAEGRTGRPLRSIMSLFVHH